jgi:hypothetical protein
VTVARWIFDLNMVRNTELLPGREQRAPALSKT